MTAAERPSLAVAAGPVDSALSSMERFPLACAVGELEAAAMAETPRHPARRGHRFRSMRMAPAVLAVGLLQAAAVTIEASAPRAEIVPYAESTSADPGDDFEIHVLNGGKEIELYGAIAYGAADALQRALREHPAVVLHLRSMGGDAAESFRLATLVENHALTTYAPGDCASACATVFAAGYRRLLGPKARLGFHMFRSRYPGYPAYSMERFDLYLTRKGVPRSFVSRIYTVPPDSIWHPPADELLRVGIATEIVRPSDFAASGGLARAIARFDREAPRYASLQALNEFAADDFAALVETFVDGIERDLAVTEVRAAAMPILERAVRTRLPRASDAAVRESARVKIEQIDAMRDIHGEACFDDALGSVAFQYSFGFFGDGLRDREERAMVEVLRSAARAPESPASAEEAGPALEEIRIGLERRFGSGASGMLKPETGKADRLMACAVAVARYEAILDLPAATGAAILRHLADRR
jgi:hypothetical protein